MGENEGMQRRGRPVALPLALVCLALLGTGTHPSARQGTAAPTPGKVEELAALGRLWGEVKFVHPWLHSRDIDWDAALLAVVPQALEARGPEEFRDAVAELLAVLDDPVTRVVPPAALEASHVVTETPATIERDGAGNVLIRAPASDRGAEVLRRLVREPRTPPFTGAIFDLRGAIDGDSLEAYRAAFEATLESLLHGSCRMPSWRHVKYSGYPPERGTTSGGYTREFQQTEPRVLEGEAERGIPLVFVIDERSRGVGDHLLALQLAGLAKIVLESRYEDLDGREDGAAVVPIDLSHGIRVEIRASERIGPDAELGFRPDVHLLPGADAGVALQQARSVLSGKLAATKPEYPKASSKLVHRPERDYADQDTLGPEYRLLGLFRYWCTLSAFQPYLRQLDRPWEEVLVEFVPRLLAARDTAAYERALAELAASTQDSHSYTVSRTLMQAYGVAVPRVALSFVEDRPVVVQVLDPAIEGVSVGDVLRSVDGVPVEQRIEAVGHFLAHSTPQALRDRLKDVLLGGEKDTLAHATFEGARGTRECSLLRCEDYVQATRSTPVYGILPSGHGYMDLERLEEEQVAAAFDAVAAAPGLIFDLRGYSNATLPSIGPRLGDGNGPLAAVFYRNEIGADGPGVRSSLRFEQHVPKRKEGVRAFDGPVVVLIDERAISRAEHACLYLKAAAAERITFIGTPTNGTNGDTTNSVLPGGIRFGFTGHDVRFPDESQLQRRGIQPDLVVAPTIAGVRAGRDEVLERAVRFLESGK